MATTGAVTIDLNNFGTSINNASQLGESVIGGVKDQGDLIGLAIGITIAVTLLFGVILLMITLVRTLIGRVKGIKKA